MKWTYSVKNKLTASAALFSLCLLVLYSNYIDRDHTQNVKNSINTLYSDRLIAESYILKITSYVYQIKEVLNASLDDTQKNNQVTNLLSGIHDLSKAYQATKFTIAEEKKADELKNVLKDLEPTTLTSHQQKLTAANKALTLLNDLSAIQLDESKKIMANAETLYLSGKLSSQFVFAVIIIILLVLQALVFTSKSLVPKDALKSPHLN